MNIEKVFHLYKTPRTRILTLCRNSSKKFFARTCKPFWIPLNFILIDPFFLDFIFFTNIIIGYVEMAKFIIRHDSIRVNYIRLHFALICHKQPRWWQFFQFFSFHVSFQTLQSFLPTVAQLVPFFHQISAHQPKRR